MEALRTRLDNLTWEKNQLETENRRLREEHPDQSHVLQLEEELEQSKTEAEQLRDRIKQCAEQTTASEQTEQTEPGAASELQEALSRSKNRESELEEQLKVKAAEFEQYRLEEEQRGEARELKYYRLLESERSKWEAREQRALDELDHLRRTRQESTATEDDSLSRQLEEAKQREQHLQELSEHKDESICHLQEQLETCQGESQHLRGQLETCRSESQHLQGQLEDTRSENQHLQGQLGDSISENQQLRAELEGAKIKIQELEGPSTKRNKESAAPTITLPSHGLHVTAPSFTPAAAVRFSLPGQTNLKVGSLPSFSPLAGFGAAGLTTCTSVSSSPTAMPTFPYSPMTAYTSVSSSPATKPTFTYSPTTTTAIAGGHATQPLPVSTESVSTPVTTPFHFTPTPSPYSTSFNPGLTGAASATPYPPMVHPAHLPSIPSFHGGDQRDGETFEEWLDHFEAVARVARWDKNFKTVHLTAALRGNAKSFYRSCTPTQKADYDQLIGALKKRFTPVKLTALQTQMFHSRKQGASESVDDYAQELRKLHSKAYSTTIGGNTEAEKVGQIVLLNQFVSGLRPEIQAKVVGVEGSVDEIVAKARFEEAKWKEVSGRYPQKLYQNKNRFGGPVNRNLPTPATPPKVPLPTPSDRTDPPKTPRGKNVACYRCGMEGHYKTDCPYQKTPKNSGESRGKSQVKHMTPQENSDSVDKKQEIEILREKLRQAELDAAIESLNAVKAVIPADKGSRLGPTVYATVALEGISVEALIDTGSPATIASLEFVWKVLKSNRPKEQTDAQWIESTRKKLKAPDVMLKSYGGHRLDFIAQTELTLSRGRCQMNTTILVRKNAPNDLLLGTDVQPQLGFSLVTKDADGGTTDLFASERLTPSESKPTVREESRESPHEPGVTQPVQKEVETRLLDGKEVRLLQAVKIPAGMQKVVRATVGGTPLKGPLMFTPSELSQGLQMADSVVEMKEDQFLTLVLQNSGVEKECLEEGTHLGLVTATTVLSRDESDLSRSAELSRLQSLTVEDLPHDDADKRQERIAKLFNQIGTDFSHLVKDDRESLQSLLSSYSDVFALDPSELGTTELVTHPINTGQHLPIKQPLRRTPFALRNKVEELVDDMLKQGVIEPSASPWASPIVLVQKKDGGIRFCVDYRKLNQITKLDEFPLPRIDDTLDILNGSKYFSALDLASGYWQVAMDEDSKEKTAFTTFAGLYQFRKMPFGLVNAPATFQRLMEIVLSGLARSVCVVYLDDVLVFGRTMEEHNVNLSKVTDRLREAGLKLRPGKCRFALTEVEYLGHVVSEHGVRADPKKVEAVRQFPVPQDVKTLRSFLGLASYYRKFVPGFAKIAGPLHALTKKDVPFAWTHNCQKAFDDLKELLINSPLLVFPDFSRPFVLETDASGAGLGAVLAQKQDDGSVHPVAYASRSLQSHEKNYGITELEGLGVVWAVKHFRPYLYGHSCEVFTDHSALTSLLNTPQPSGKLARWGMAIQVLNLTIKHRSGHSNVNADTLSRAPLSDSEDLTEPDGVIAAMDLAADSDHSALSAAQREDSDLSEIIVYLETGVLPEDESRARTLVLSSSQYVIEDDVLYRVEKDSTLRIIPPRSQRQLLFTEAHAGVFGAHLSDTKVHSELRRHYWWHSMRADITHWTRACLVCNTYSPGRAVHSPLTPIPVNGPFDRVGVDVIQFPTSSRGNKYAVVFMDYLTKWPEVFPTPDQTAATIANLLVREIVARHGVPSELLSDRGQAFLSELLKEVQVVLGYKKVNTTAYHPQTDGLVERFNRTLINMLAKTVERDGKDWDQRLPFVLFAYRASQQMSTQESPFFLLYGRDPRLPTQTVLSSKKTRHDCNLKEYGASLARRTAEAWEDARKCIGKAQKRQKNCYDRKARPPRFGVGDRVFLFKPADKTGPLRKFARPYHGPYRVVEMDLNTARIRRIDRPEEDTILVALDRLRACPEELASDFWPPKKKRPKKRGSPGEQTQDRLDEATPNEDDKSPCEEDKSPCEENKSPHEENKSSRGWSGRLRKRK